MVQRILAYRASDGMLFEDEKVLKEYEDKMKIKEKNKRLYNFIRKFIQKPYYKESEIKKNLVEQKELLIEILRSCN